MVGNLSPRGLENIFLKDGERSLNITNSKYRLCDPFF